MKKRKLFCFRRSIGKPLKCVPIVSVTTAHLIDREIALKHAPVDAKSFDASFNIRTPGISECCRTGRDCKFVELKTKELTDDYEEKFSNPYRAASKGYIDEVIEASQTRPKLIRALNLLKNKRDSNPPKKHGNIPL